MTGNPLFPLIVTGVRHSGRCVPLRDLLDRLLAARLPHIHVLSGCGLGTDLLAACYARRRGQPL